MSLRLDGQSLQYVTEIMIINKSNVSRVLRRFRETRGYNRRPIPGRPRCTNPVDDRYLSLQTLRTCHVRARQLQNVLSKLRKVRILCQIRLETD